MEKSERLKVNVDVAVVRDSEVEAEVGSWWMEESARLERRSTSCSLSESTKQ